MAGGAFAVRLDPLEAPTAHGAESVVFEVRGHAGAGLAPLAKVASGGELARLSLALRTVTARSAPVPTVVFDEVDSGIGGAVAEIVGRMLAALGATRQVLCITHLPQVAACAGRQWQVAKAATADGGVASRVTALDTVGRIEEVARMLGGVVVTATTRRHAQEMLDAAAR
jgi:DNA repair protein RecN (Recombination protein N)